MNTIDTIITRRSTRKFKKEKLSKDIINKVVEAGRFAPSGGNSQSTHFIVVTSEEVLNKLEEQVKNSFSKMENYDGMYKSLVNSINASKKGKYIYDYSAPVLIITANRKEYGNNMADCACALENMMLAANEYDLGSCWINQLKWLNEDEKILEILHNIGMKDDERVYGALAVGFPDTEDSYPVRDALPRTGNLVTYVE